MARQAVTKTLSLRPEDARRFERLVARFGRGSTTEFVRTAMKRLETSEQAEELADLRRYGQRRAKQVGVESVDVRVAVRKVLNSK